MIFLSICTCTIETDSLYCRFRPLIMRSCLLLCAALCVGQLVCALPSAQYVAPIYNPDELPPMIKLPVRKTVIGAPCAVTDVHDFVLLGTLATDCSQERQKFGTVPNPDAEDKRLAGKCVQQKNCPPERLHFGYPSFCSKETGMCLSLAHRFGVLCLCWLLMLILMRRCCLLPRPASYMHECWWPCMDLPKFWYQRLQKRPVPGLEVCHLTYYFFFHGAQNLNAE